MHLPVKVVIGVCCTCSLYARMETTVVTICAFNGPKDVMAWLGKCPTRHMTIIQRRLNVNATS